MSNYFLRSTNRSRHLLINDQYLDNDKNVRRKRGIKLYFQ